MKIEILATNGIKSAFKEFNIAATRTYRDAEKSHFEVWEIEKSDLAKLENATEWHKGWGWYSYSKGSNLGSACDFFTVNGQFMIGWSTADSKDTYDTLNNYFSDGLKIFDKDEICAAIVGLMRANGMTMTNLLKTYQG